MSRTFLLASMTLTAVIAAVPAAAGAQTAEPVSPAPANPAQAPSDAPTAQNPRALAGEWTLNRDKSALSGRAPDGTGERAGSDPGEPGANGRGGYGGRHGGGRGGFGHAGGGFGRHGGGRMGGGGAGRSPEQFEALRDFMQTQLQPVDRMTIVVAPDHVSFANADGSSLTLQTNGKKQEARAGNGLVKYTIKSSWDGPVLVSEINVDNGPRVTRRYELAADLSELQVTTTVTGNFGRQKGRDRSRVVVYDRGDGTQGGHSGPDTPR